MSMISRAVCAAALFAALAVPAAADEVEEAVAAALDAYRAGDMALAKEELDYASSLVGQMKAEGFSGFLPDPMPGWTRTIDDGQADGAALFGGVTASAAYVDAAGAEVAIQMMADNPMVASMGAMFSNPAMMGAMGKLIRAGRQKAVLTADGEIQALVANRVLVTIGGDAPEAAKIAYFKLIDFKALGDM
jgi:hypothetical protein